MAAFSSSSYISSNLVKIRHENHHALRPRLPLLRPSFSTTTRRRTVVSESHSAIKAAAGNLTPNYWDSWKPDQGSKAPSLSDILWPSAGAFAAMAVLGKMDQMLARKGVSMTIAPLGAVCAVLFATPATPGARKYNVFMAQMGCAAIGVLAFSLFGPGWLARSTALSVSLAFMIYARAVHPPAASLPLLFIDGAKFHHLKFWYILFPGAAGCLLLCLIDLSSVGKDMVGKSGGWKYTIEEGVEKEEGLGQNTMNLTIRDFAMFCGCEDDAWKREENHPE